MKVRFVADHALLSMPVYEGHPLYSDEPLTFEVPNELVQQYEHALGEVRRVHEVFMQAYGGKKTGAKMHRTCWIRME